jgi:hypothetical protein
MRHPAEKRQKQNRQRCFSSYSVYPANSVHPAIPRLRRAEARNLSKINPRSRQPTFAHPYFYIKSVFWIGLFWDPTQNPNLSGDFLCVRWNLFRFDAIIISQSPLVFACDLKSSFRQNSKIMRQKNLSQI